MNFSGKLIKVAATATLMASLACTNAFGLYAANTTASVNFRQTAGGSIISTLPKGTQIAVIDNNGDWFRIAVNGMTGYVSGEYIKGTPDCDFSLGTATVTCESSVNLRAEPNTDSEVLSSVSNGSTVAVLGVKNDWYKVQVGDTVGYMFTPYVYVNGRMASQTSRSDSSDAEAKRNQVLDYAASFLGTPYVYGGSSPSGFDCSGFTSYVYKNTVRSIPRTATSQRNALTNVSMDELKPADLVFFGSGGSISHVGIYVGNGKFIHSPHTGSVVKYDTLWSGNYNRRFVSGARVIFD
ncbi:C40 family peptidase [Intestinibacillus massiliensis]|uniref:C40 family peptidase n=1 Tax=Intestinibacillus massiliensis TaxID=1871029 RepID=UPI0013566BA9|nr:C40 family peptidase [Intestinibacillus massiliensis]